MNPINKKHIATLVATDFIVRAAILKIMEQNLDEFKDTDQVNIRISETVRSYLKDDEGSELPICEFKPNNVLFEEVLKACGLGETCLSTEGEQERITRWQKELSVLEENEIFSQVADSIATKVASANEVIRGIKSKITGLAEEINKKTNTYISSDPFLHKHYKPVDAEITYDPFPFDVLNLVGDTGNLMSYIYEEVGFSTPDRSSRSQFSVAMEKFASLKLKDDRVVDIDMTKETKEAIIEAVNKANKNLVCSVIRDTLNMLISSKRLVVMKNRIMNNYKRTETTEACVSMLGTISDIRGYTDDIIKVVVAMDLPEVSEKMANNINFTDECTDLCAFYVTWHRENTFANTVLFRNKMLNPDMQEECKKANVENVDLARHCTKVYGTGTIPTIGITLTSVLNQKERIAKKVEREDAQLEIRVRAGVIEKQRNAFFSVVFGWLEEESIEDLPHSNLAKYVQHKAEYLAGKNMTVEDVLYDITIRLFHKDTFVNTLFDRLGVEYHRMVAENSNVTVGDIAMTNLCTYTELVTEFISNQFMSKK